MDKHKLITRKQKDTLHVPFGDKREVCLYIFKDKLFEFYQATISFTTVTYSLLHYGLVTAGVFALLFAYNHLLSSHEEGSDQRECSRNYSPGK